jgi:hypothetical protein
MSTATTTDPDVLDARAFVPELPCEYSGHGRLNGPGGAPAKWVAEGLCGQCGHHPVYLICEPDRVALLKAMTLRCSRCGIRGRPRDFITFRPIEDAP